MKILKVKKHTVPLFIGIIIFLAVLYIQAVVQENELRQNITSGIEDYYGRIIQSTKQFEYYARLQDGNQKDEYLSKLELLINRVKSDYEYFRLLNYYAGDLQELEYKQRDNAIAQLWQLLNLSALESEDYLNKVNQGIQDEIADLENLR